MIGKLNSNLRKLFILLGSVFAVCKLIEGIDIPTEPQEEGFQTHEFDDIW